MNLNYKLLDDLTSNIALRYIGKQYEDQANDNKLDDYTLVDLGLNYNINKITSIYSGVDNIFDKKVDERVNINVGAYYFAGIKVSF